MEMNDFKNLDKQRQTVLQIKLDGFAEAAVQAARTQNIGPSEALLLACHALVREMAAYSLDRDIALSFWEEAIQKGYPEQPSARQQLVC